MTTKKAILMTMLVRKIILLFIFVSVLPLSAWGSADFDNSLIVDINDLAIFTDYWLLYTTEPEDLDGSGFIDFKDYSIFASDWKKYCCDDLNGPDPTALENWQEIVFTGIGPCGGYDCWFGPGISDPCYDNCGWMTIVMCDVTPEFDYYCAYNFYYSGLRVGLCVYDCGINYFWILENNDGCRITATMHITRDRPPQDPYCYPQGEDDCDGCDEQYTGYYNWQTVFTTVVNVQKTGWCRYGYQFDPRPSAGTNGPCKLVWW